MINRELYGLCSISIQANLSEFLSCIYDNPLFLFLRNLVLRVINFELVWKAKRLEVAILRMPFGVRFCIK